MSTLKKRLFSITLLCGLCIAGSVTPQAIASPEFTSWDPSADFVSVPEGEAFKRFIVVSDRRGYRLEIASAEGDDTTCSQTGTIKAVAQDGSGEVLTWASTNFFNVRAGVYVSVTYGNFRGPYGGVLTEDRLYKLNFAKWDGTHVSDAYLRINSEAEERTISFNRIEGPFISYAVSNGIVNMGFIDTWNVHTSGSCVGKAEAWPSGQWIGEIQGSANYDGSCSFSITPDDLSNNSGTVKINVQNEPYTTWYGAVYYDLN